MSTNSNRNTGDQEIDLAMISDKVKGFGKSINDTIFSIIQFFVNRKITIIILFVLGFSLGLFLDKTSKTYDHEIVVSPNFGSTDYLYAKINLIESKISENDTVFLKSIGMKNPKNLKKIEIKPILDIYQFINNSNSKNFELLKLMVEDNDIKTIVTEKTTSKNYRYHTISFTTSGYITKKEYVVPLLNYLNSSDFFAKIRKESINNIHVQTKANELIIAQIDSFLNGFSSGGGEGKSDKLVYYNENSPLKDIIEAKERVITEQGNMRINLINFDKIIKEISEVLNIQNNKAANGKLKILFPLLLIFLYTIIVLFRKFYKRQIQINTSNI